MTDWFEETLHDGLRLKLRIDRVLYESRTAHQRLVLFENATFGRVLALDGVVQTTERDEFVYHEMLVHVPILGHGQARDVLIIGGGDGGSLEETLKHRAVESVTIVEIDAGVVEFSQRYLRSICGDAFDDPRTDLVIADGVAFVADCAHRYDVIIVDSTDPIGPGEALFTAPFYAACKACLKPGGVLVTQNGVPFLQAPELRDSLAFLRPHFADAGCYQAAVPTYIGGLMAFGWATDDAALRQTPAATLKQRFDAAAIETSYYTPDVHHAAFALPRFVAALGGGQSAAPPSP